MRHVYLQSIRLGHFTKFPKTWMKSTVRLLYQTINNVVNGFFEIFVHPFIRFHVFWSFIGASKYVAGAIILTELMFVTRQAKQLSVLRKLKRMTTSSWFFVFVVNILCNCLRQPNWKRQWVCLIIIPLIGCTGLTNIGFVLDASLCVVLHKIDDREKNAWLLILLDAKFCTTFWDSTWFSGIVILLICTVSNNNSFCGLSNNLVSNHNFSFSTF